MPDKICLFIYSLILKPIYLSFQKSISIQKKPKRHFFFSIESLRYERDPGNAGDDTNASLNSEIEVWYGDNFWASYSSRYSFTASFDNAMI